MTSRNEAGHVRVNDKCNRGYCDMISYMIHLNECTCLEQHLGNIERLFTTQKEVGCKESQLWWPSNMAILPGSQEKR
jgi:hypothetical protein